MDFFLLKEQKIGEKIFLWRLPLHKGFFFPQRTNVEFTNGKISPLTYPSFPIYI